MMYARITTCRQHGAGIHYGQHSIIRHCLSATCYPPPRLSSTLVIRYFDYTPLSIIRHSLSGTFDYPPFLPSATLAIRLFDYPPYSRSATSIIHRLNYPPLPIRHFDYPPLALSAIKSIYQSLSILPPSSPIRRPRLSAEIYPMVADNVES